MSYSMATGLRRFESFAERLVEGTFDWLLGRRLEPVEIARRLARIMEDNQTISAGKIFVPNAYHVSLNPDTLRRFSSFKEPLEQELAAYVAEEAERLGFQFIGRPHVELSADTSVTRGKLSINADLAGLESKDVGPIEATQVLNLHAVQDKLSDSQADDESQAPLQLVLGDRIIGLDRPMVTIGRSLDNEIIVQAASMSRRHAQIIQRHGRWLLRDLQSTHGTQVNGNPVSECVLRAGDTITLGEVIIQVQDGS